MPLSSERDTGGKNGDAIVGRQIASIKAQLHLREACFGETQR